MRWRLCIAQAEFVAMTLLVQVQLVGRVETFKQDSQLDVVWKMYRVRSLVVSITAV